MPSRSIKKEFSPSAASTSFHSAFPFVLYSSPCRSDSVQPSAFSLWAGRSKVGLMNSFIKATSMKGIQTFSLVSCCPHFCCLSPCSVSLCLPKAKLQSYTFNRYCYCWAYIFNSRRAVLNEEVKKKKKSIVVFQSWCFCLFFCVSQ